VPTAPRWGRPLGGAGVGCATVAARAAWVAAGARDVSGQPRPAPSLLAFDRPIPPAPSAHDARLLARLSVSMTGRLDKSARHRESAEPVGLAFEVAKVPVDGGPADPQRAGDRGHGVLPGGVHLAASRILGSVITAGRPPVRPRALSMHRHLAYLAASILPQPGSEVIDLERREAEASVVVLAGGGGQCLRDERQSAGG
jgi:hypothetical protein